MKKIVNLLLFLILLTVSACEKKEETPVDKLVVKIGASLPLSGNMSMVGNAAYKALVAAISEANANPENKLHYQLIAEDDQMNVQMINNIAHKLIFTDKVNAIFAYFSAGVKVIAPLAAQNNVINFNVSYSDSALISPYNFQNFLTNQAEAEALVNFMKKRNLSSVTLLFQNIGAADDIIDKLLPLFEQEKITSHIERFNKGERDYKILINKVKNNEDGIIMIYAFEPEADLITKEINLQKINKIIVYTDGLPMTQNYEIYEGYYNVGSVLASDDLMKRMGLRNDNQAYSVYLYDSAKILINAFEKSYLNNGLIPSADDVSAMLHSQKRYDGEVGRYILDDKGQFHSSGVTLQVKDGKFVTIEE